MNEDTPVVPMANVSPTKILAPLWVRVCSILLIIAGILGVFTYIAGMGMSVLFLTGAASGVLATALLFQFLNTVPAILYIVGGFGLRYLKKWSLVLFVIAIAFLVGRVILRASGNTMMITNFIEPILLTILTLVCYRKKEIFH